MLWLQLTYLKVSSYSTCQTINLKDLQVCAGTYKLGCVNVGPYSWQTC